jgi:hypothetical protein
MCCSMKIHDEYISVEDHMSASIVFILLQISEHQFICLLFICSLFNRAVICLKPYSIAV